MTPSGDVSAFGLDGAEAHTAIEITPLGWGSPGRCCCRTSSCGPCARRVPWSPRRTRRARGCGGRALPGGAGLAGVGGPRRRHDRRAFARAGGAGRAARRDGGGGIEIPGLGDVGDIGGLLPDRIGDLAAAEASVGFTVDAGPTLLGGLCWSAGVLLIALLASRRTPLPRGWDALHRVVRPAVSAVVTVLMLAVAAGLAAAAWAAATDDRPGRIAGAALLGRRTGCGSVCRSASSCRGRAGRWASRRGSCPIRWTTC